MKNPRQNFNTDIKGGVGLIVGIALVLVLIGIMSLVVDMNRTQTSYAKNQDSTDAAALATSEFVLRGIIDQIGKIPDPFSWRPTDAELKKYAGQLVEQNFKISQSSAIYDPTSLRVTYTKTTAPNGIGSNYKITVYACADLDTKIAKAADNKSSTRTCTNSNAGFSLTTDKKVEVGLALDYTSSMYCKGTANCRSNANSAAREIYSQTKAFKLVETMNYIFNNYFAADGETPRGIYASVIPFTNAVNLYPYSSRFVTQLTTLPTLPTPNSYYTGDYYFDYGFEEDLVGATSTNEYLNFDRNFAYALNRVPAIGSESQLNSILNSNSPTNFLPLDSFRTTFDANDQGDNDKYFCYNTAIHSALDQRIEKEYFAAGTTAGNQLRVNGEVALSAATVKKVVGGKAVNQATPTKSLLLRESFPVQPLTNNRTVLKDTVGRFVTNGAGQRLFNNISYGASVLDSQSSRLNKTFSFTTGTSSIHGLLWAWLSINNNLNGNWWAEPSVMEKYIGGPISASSSNSRALLPSNQNLKHIILITDGNDNDGALNTPTDPKSVKNMCDAYSPKAPISDNQYVALCDRIKRDDVIIHTILFDFTPTAGVINKYERCASPGEYYENVTPSNLQTVMDKIFKDILTNLVTVKLVQ